MTKETDDYGVNLIPPVAWALDLYFKKKPKHKYQGVIEITFPSGQHKEMMRSKGDHEIILVYSKRTLWVRSRCTFDKKCEFNSERFNGRDREALKAIDWDMLNNRTIFTEITKMLLKLNLDFVTLIRALNTVCDHKVEIPLTTKYGKTFEKFDEYRRNKWPEETTPEDKKGFIEEVLVRVCFWIMSAAAVGALKVK